MLVGRFMMIIPMLAIAGNLAQKEICPPVAGHLPGDYAFVHGAFARSSPELWVR